MDESPDEHISSYRDLLETLEREFLDDESAIEIIEGELENISSWVREQAWSEEEASSIHRR